MRAEPRRRRQSAVPRQPLGHRTGDPLVAADVNRSEVLLDRVEECEEERDRRPNIIAVDFYTHGDLLDVVAELNASG